MPLSSAKIKLEEDIKKAYTSSKEAAEENDANPDTIIDVLASGLGDAIHNFMLQAQVNVQIQIPPEITSPPPAASLNPAACSGKGGLT